MRGEQDKSSSAPPLLCACGSRRLADSSSSTLPYQRMKEEELDPLIIERDVEKIAGWQTDTFSIDFSNPGSGAPHTIIVFVPGNPGLVEWYIPFFAQILKCLGHGYAVRGASYAGHSIDPLQIDVEGTEFTKSLAWTIDGQVHHKINYIDQFTKRLQKEFSAEPPKLIFVGHSIGCHLVQRILMLRTDILCRTTRCILLMPFIRMDAPAPHQQLLDLASKFPHASTWILQTLARGLSTYLDRQSIQDLLKSTMDKAEDREFTAELLRQTNFPRNFLGLGVEEIREVPQAIDVSALSCIMKRHGVPVAMLFAGNDHWSPEFHMYDLQQLVMRGVLPPLLLNLTHNPELKHSFVTAQTQIPFVVDYCVNLIQQQQPEQGGNLRSRL